MKFVAAFTLLLWATATATTGKIDEGQRISGVGAGKVNADSPKRTEKHSETMFKTRSYVQKYSWAIQQYNTCVEDCKQKNREMSSRKLKKFCKNECRHLHPTENPGPQGTRQLPAMPDAEDDMDAKRGSQRPGWREYVHSNSHIWRQD